MCVITIIGKRGQGFEGSRIQVILLLVASVLFITSQHVEDPLKIQLLAPAFFAWTRESLNPRPLLHGPTHPAVFGTHSPHVLPVYIGHHTVLFILIMPDSQYF